MSNNFGFLKPLNEKLYELCEKMDKNSKTEPNESVNNLRESVEEFMRWFAKLNHFNLEKHDGTEKTTYELIEEGFTKKRLLGWQRSELHSVRKYSNSGLHNTIDTNVTKNMNFIKKFHKVLAVYLRYKQLIKQPVYFDEDQMLIGNYRPIKKIDIETYEEGCEKKYLCTYISHG